MTGNGKLSGRFCVAGPSTRLYRLAALVHSHTCHVSPHPLTWAIPEPGEAVSPLPLPAAVDELCAPA